MDLVKLIHQHDRLLQQKAEENVFLNERLKARLKDSHKMKDPLKRGLRKIVLLYSFLFILFTIINFIGIGLIKKNADPPRPDYIVKMDAFEANYPGSISKVYQEVIKWGN